MSGNLHGSDREFYPEGRPSKVARRTGEEQEETVEVENREECKLVSCISEAMNRKSQRYLLAVEYIGSRFCGSQKQPNGRTVAGVLEEAFCKFIGQPVSIALSSRTDAGVHAFSNVCHVDIERISKRKPDELLQPHGPDVVKRAVNHFLQKNEGDIMLIDVKCVPSDFHARYRAQERRYFYRLVCGPDSLSTFEKDRAWHVSDDLNLNAMQDACKVLVGHHDFSSFRASGCQAKSPIRSLDELSVTEVVCNPFFPCETPNISMESSVNLDTTRFGMRRSHRCFTVVARARSFLYHQVRLLVGVLKAVGTGDLTVSDVSRILDAKSVTAASPMAPACGLYLAHVNYDLP